MKCTITSNSGLVMGTIDNLEKYGTETQDRELIRKIGSVLLHFALSIDDRNLFTWLRDEDEISYGGEYLTEKTVRIDRDPETGSLFVVEVEPDSPSTRPIFTTAAENRLELEAYLEYLECKVVGK